MTINNLERVMWRLRKKQPGLDRFTNNQLMRAIMYECGTDRRTYSMNRRALLKLGWIKAYGNKHIELTGHDITGDEH